MATQLENIASRFEPKLRTAMLTAFDKIKGSITLRELEEAITTRGIDGIINILNNMKIEDFIKKELIGDINQAIIESGRITIGLIPVGGVLNEAFSYNPFHSITADFIQNYELNLIRTISNNTRDAIRNSIQADLISGRNPKETAKTFKDTIGLTPRQELAVRNYRKSLEDLDRSVLDRALRDKRFDPTVTQAILNKKSLTKDQVNNMVNSYRGRYIKHRAETIARTESLRAIAIGEYSSAIQAVREGAINGDIVRRFWINQDDKRTRNHHRQISSLNLGGVGVDQPFVTPLGPLRFPRDPNGSAANTINCRCIVVYRIIDEVNI